MFRAEASQLFQQLFDESLEQEVEIQFPSGSFTCAKRKRAPRQCRAWPRADRQLGARVLWDGAPTKPHQLAVGGRTFWHKAVQFRLPKGRGDWWLRIQVCKGGTAHPQGREEEGQGHMRALKSARKH